MKRAVLASLIVLSLASSLSADTLDALVIGAAGADLWSTRVAIQRGGVEANPLMGSLASQALLKGAVTGVALWQCRQWERTGHRKAAKVGKLTLVAVWTGAAVWNLTRGGR